MAPLKFCCVLMVLYNVTTASITSPRGKSIPRRVSTTSYSHGKGHDHKHIHHPDDAYFYEYLVHGIDNENHHGDTQYFGQAEYRDDETVNENIVTSNFSFFNEFNFYLKH